MKVRLIHHIHGTFGACSTEDAWVFKEIELPFAPFPKLYLNDLCYSIETVAWNGEKERFDCYDEEDKEIYNAVLHNKITDAEKLKLMKKKISNALDEDWMVQTWPRLIKCESDLKSEKGGAA